MSREQIFGSTDIDGRTDVFSLGVVLYEALTGTRPFEAPTLEALAMRITSGSSTPIESLRPDLPLSLMEVVRHAIATDRTQRLPSARALVDALAPFRSGTTRIMPPPADLGLDKTHVAESTPDGALSSVSAVTGASGARKSRTPVAIVAAGALVVGGVMAFAFTRRHEPATISMPSDLPAKQGVSAGPALPAPMPAPSASTPGVSAETPSVTLAALPEAGASAPRKPPASPKPPAPAVSAPPPAASHNLGLSQENPFR